MKVLLNSLYGKPGLVKITPSLPKNYSLLFCLLIMLLSTGLSAAQIPDPAASQKQMIDNMHHKLHNDQAPYKENEAQALKELNEMAIRKDVAIKDLNTKIDELMEAKTQIMRLRYEHLIEMRTILSDEQKVTYDEAILKRSQVK